MAPGGASLALGWLSGGCQLEAQPLGPPHAQSSHPTFQLHSPSLLLPHSISTCHLPGSFLRPSLPGGLHWPLLPLASQVKAQLLLGRRDASQSPSPASPQCPTACSVSAWARRRETACHLWEQPCALLRQGRPGTSSGRLLRPFACKYLLACIHTYTNTPRPGNAWERGTPWQGRGGVGSHS